MGSFKWQKDIETEKAIFYAGHSNHFYVQFFMSIFNVPKRTFLYKWWCDVYVGLGSNITDGGPNYKVNLENMSNYRSKTIKSMPWHAS